MRDAWLPLGLVLLVGVAAPIAACGQAFKIVGTTGTGGGSSTVSGGGGGSDSSTGGGGAASAGITTSTGGMPCMNAADCPGPTSVCGAPTCKSGKCDMTQLLPPGDLYSKLYGDCHLLKCTANGVLVNAVNNADLYDDGNICTKDACTMGVPSNTPMIGSSCNNNGHCDSQGACVACLEDGDCDGGKKCLNGHCSPSSCMDGALIPPETDADCGGNGCPPCADSKHCLNGGDCQSGVCKIPPAEALLKCIAATCVDGVKNGRETDIDCGGLDCQAKCSKNDTCKLGSDCVSGVCQSGTCRLETCTDGVKNGAETGIDCGSGVSACPACP